MPDAVPANDFRRQWEDIREDALAAFSRVAESGWYILGGEVSAFEQALASYWGLRHAIGVASGLDAIEIALRILGCGPGDRVLTTPLSAFATTLAIAKLGAIPVFADTDEYGLIDLARCRDIFARRSDIRYFLPVHLYGHALDSGALQRLKDEFELKVVEDCAQSIGARFHGAPTGTVGQLAATSFYPTKNLGAMGDGGAILTNDIGLRDRAAALRDYGQSAKYRHEFPGYNSRLDELQAAMLRDACLPRLERWIARRRHIAKMYLEGIRNPAVHPMGAPDGSDSCWHLFPVLAEPGQRQQILDAMKARGIGASIHYPVAIPDQPAMRALPAEMADDCVTARRLCASEISFPIHPYLSDDEVTAVLAAV